MLKRVLFFVAGLLLASLLGAAVVAGQESRGEDARRVDEKEERLARVLEKLGESVARYQSGLFGITYTETILEERLKRDLRAREGRAKEYVFRLKYERAETATRFRRVEFKDPAGTLLMPASSESLRVIEGASRPRARTTRTFKDYRRFVSDVKIVEEAEPEN